jgi:heat shock transcription factor, other eukaryote
MVEENNRLRQENKRLSLELGRMKKVCSNIFNLVSDINSSQVKGDHASPLQLLDLMSPSGFSSDLMSPNGFSSEHDDSGEGSSTRLFGVSIRTKRSRSAVLGDDMDLDMVTR